MHAGSVDGGRSDAGTTPRTALAGLLAALLARRLLVVRRRRRRGRRRAGGPTTTTAELPAGLRGLRQRDLRRRRQLAVQARHRRRRLQPRPRRHRGRRRRHDRGHRARGGRRPAGRLLLRLPDDQPRPGAQQRPRAGRGRGDRRPSTTRRPASRRPAGSSPPSTGRSRSSAIGGGARPERRQRPPGASPTATSSTPSRTTSRTRATGRGFVLLGHSQGAGMITRLIQDEIDDEPLLRDRLVGGLRAGVVAAGARGRGGRRATSPRCPCARPTTRPGAWSATRPTGRPGPPAEGSPVRARRRGHAGRLREPGRPRAAGRRPCSRSSSSTAARGHAARRHECDAAVRRPGPRGRDHDPVGRRTPTSSRPSASARATSPTCRSPWRATPPTPAPTTSAATSTPEWGMHLVDANVAMGDIVDLVAAQAEAYTG